MKQQTSSKSYHPAQDLEREDVQCLGECVRDLVAHLGYGTRAGTMEAVLLREAIDAAVYILTLRQGSRASLKEFREQRGYDPPEYLISMEELAQDIVHRSFADENARPSTQELRTRVRFALTLDDTCAEAYLLEGDIEEHQGRYQKARASYQRAIQLSTEKLGPNAFDEATRKERHIHYWHSTGTRPYMRARAALAYLLWRKLGKRQEALDHFRVLLELNPGDNQGNRYAVICCLLEEGNDEALGKALQRYFVYVDESGEEMDLRETCWWYTNACWKFRCASSSGPRSSRQAALKALRTGFTYNKHVPYFLLHPKALADFGEPDSYSHGDESEAAWYVSFVLKAWQQTPDALNWLEETTQRAGLLV